MPSKTKKEVAEKTPEKKVVKIKSAKTTSKKTTSAKKKTPAKKGLSAVHKHVAAEPSQVKTIEKIIHRFEKRFVFVPLCDNCEYIPMRINRLVALMTVLVVVLSGIIIAQSQPLEASEVIARAVNIVAQR